MTKKLTTTRKQIETIAGYNEILRDIRSLLEKATYQAYMTVDNLRVQTYWQIGERIARGELEHKERADYGRQVVENLAVDLEFQKRVIYRMLQFYKTYPIVSTLSTQLSWSQYQELILLSVKGERDFYEYQIVQNNWSVRELRKQISRNLYSRALKENNLVTITPMPPIPILPGQVFKDTYNFDFLQLQDGHKEKQLEEGLLYFSLS